MTYLERTLRTDLANSERIEIGYGDVLKWSPGLGWMAWSKKRWVQSNEAASKIAKKSAVSIYAEIPDLPTKTEQELMAKWASASESNGEIKATLELAKSAQGIYLKAAEFDKEDMALNTQNGILDLTTGELRQHDRGRFLSKITGASYNPIAPCPNWLAFLDLVMQGDKEMIEFLQRSVGYSLTGDASEKIFFLVYGTTDTGKSTFINAIQRMLGDYALTTSSSTFMQKTGGASNDVAQLKGARFVCALESDANSKMATSVVKSMTGRDKMSARFLFKEYFEFVPQFKIWLATNHQPTVSASDDAIWRRIKQIPFDYHIPLEDQDAHFAERLDEEMDGILSWAVDGCLKWQDDGLKIPEKVLESTRVYREGQDTIRLAFDDCFIENTSCETPAADLYAKYSSWCAKCGEKASLQKDFAHWMEEHGFTSKRTKRGIVRAGIGLL